LHVADVGGVQVTAGPQGFGSLGSGQVTLGQPGGAYHQFAAGLAVVGHVVHLGIDDAQVHQGQRQAGLGPDHRLLFRRQFEIGAFEVGDGQHRAGFRHAVAGEQVDAAGDRLGREAGGEGRAADDHLAARKVGLVCGGLVGEQHVQDGRHAVGEAHALAGDQLEQHVRTVTTGVNLLHAEHGRQVGHAPGVHVEHRGDRHVHVVAVHPPLPGRAAEGGRHRQGVQHQLTVAEVHALR